MGLDLLTELKQLLPQCLLADRVRLGVRLAAILSRKPGAPGPAGMEKMLAQARQSAATRHWRAGRLSDIDYPSSLPITVRKEEIVALLKKHQVVIVTGETGSGKTTQLPKMCLEAGFGVDATIGCTQPRRVAALSISQRVAEELRVPWGREVGCKIRFSDQTTQETLVKFMTDGMLLAETQADPWLSEYEVIIIDEAHERSLNIDFLLGYLKGLVDRRNDLKVIITSATIDNEAFVRAFRAPLVEVSGRMFPVEVRYGSLEDPAEEEQELDYIDAALKAIEEVLIESDSGDLLVFMPGERDIRETRDLIQGRRWGGVETIPLFGRLTAAEQQRVFAPSPNRKITIATNIAETSLTIPGIKYVIDAGLARLSRYDARTRTRRLPIEPISQSSADQRKGRCGRVQNGICIRLYSQADFLERPRFTQPEIQRCNLADVILRMKAFGLGQIETFPFLDPPTPKAIQGGYQLLRELGALDENKELTALGRDLARLPVDPTIGRMILQARDENALREVLVIAAGLSIQDPRERPLDAAAAADGAHRRFHHQSSDFLSLLNIWDDYHDQWDRFKTQNQLRKFCKTHFLSFNRIREWRDIHYQLVEAVEDWPEVEINQAEAGYEAIHRSILTGLWSHIGRRSERNQYKGGGNRQFMVFPGSSLFDRQPNKKEARRDGKAPGAPGKSSQPEWIVAGELMETSRLFARTVAEINPEWILSLGGHLCEVAHFDPHWSAKASRVLVHEKITLFGLEVALKLVAYAKVNPEEASEIFIRKALIEEDLLVEYPFVKHNRAVREKMELWRTRLRQGQLGDLDETMFQFYAQHLPGISSLPDLNRVIKEQPAVAGFLCMSEQDFAADPKAAWDGSAFPDAVPLANRVLPVVYAYAPGQAHDGVTVTLPASLAHDVTPAALQWLVPGLREEIVGSLLEALPKTIRRQLMPLQPKIREIASQMTPVHASLLEDLALFLRARYRLNVGVSDWPPNALPEHLHPRVSLVGKDQQVLEVSRDLGEIRRRLANAETPAELKAWQMAVEQWERYDLQAWSFGDMPEKIEVTDIGGSPLFAYPGLQVEDQSVNLRMFRNGEEARGATPAGFRRLCELALHRELAWFQKDLRRLEKEKLLYATFATTEQLIESAYQCVAAHLFQCDQMLPLRQVAFEKVVQNAQARLGQTGVDFMAALLQILRQRQEIMVCRKPYPGMAQDLNALLPPRFLSQIPFAQLPQIPRYLKAMQVRAERAALNPVKDQEKWRRVQPYLETFRRLAGVKAAVPNAAPLLNEFRWLLEELRVSHFAQELGTAQPVSPKRLDQIIQAIEGVK